MATITNIRIYTQSKAVPNAGYIAIDKVMMECNTIVAMGGDVRYVLGVVPMENIVVDTPSAPEECGCNTTNANIFATLIKGVDGITPDMSDYYDKGQVDNKLSTKQDVISDIDNIRRNALKGAIALQSVPSEYVTETELQNKGYATTAQVGAKQDKISDLDAIRQGAAKGATALQPASLADYVSKKDVDAELSETSTNPVQNQAVMNTLLTLEEVLGGLLDQKQPVIPDLEAIRDGAAKGATALQEHQPLKTINGESIIGEGDITIEGGGGSADLEGYATEEYVNNAVAEANVKGEDGYVYSNGEKVDMRFTRSLIPVGTSIPAKANLNTVAYLKVGKYYCSLNADAKTITNCPTASAFMMEVFNPLSTVVDNEVDSTHVYRIRILTEYSTGIQYVQYCTVGSTANKWTYDSWYVCPRTKFTLNSNKNDGTAAIGSKAQGVYVDSTGTLQKMTYSLNKTVPANAVFTDTNTKVTAVGNHYTPVEDESVVIEAPDGEVVVGLKRDAAGHVVGVMSTPMSSGGGGGGITVETDPIFSASPAATITEEKMAEWDKGATAVQPETLAGYALEGYVDNEVKALGDSLAEVASSGSYNDLQDKPNIPSAINIAGTNYTPGDSGIIDLNRAFLYRKPSGGIPKEDLSSEVQTSLRDAEAYKGTVTGVKINGITKSSSNGVVDLGDIPTSIPSEVYITDFDALSLESLSYGDIQSLELDKQGLKDALAAHKVILVPYEIADNTSFKGYCTLVGYYEDLLYIKVITESSEIIIDTPLYTPYIFREEVTRRHWWDKQDSLKSGENIKTINGESILGEGDMVVGKTTYFSEEDSLELSPNVVWMRRRRVVNSVQITGFASNMKTYEEYAYHFNTGTIADGNAVKLILPAGVKYANKEIFDALESDTHYELSVVRSIGFVKAVLTAFK